MSEFFTPNPALGTELEAEATFDTMLRAKAEDVMEQAEVMAPDVTGYYKDRFVLRKAGKRYQVGNTDFAGALVEWGSINNPPYAPLRRGVQAAGLAFREAPKP